MNSGAQSPVSESELPSSPSQCANYFQMKQQKGTSSNSPVKQLDFDLIKIEETNIVSSDLSDITVNIFEKNLDENAKNTGFFIFLIFNFKIFSIDETLLSTMIKTVLPKPNSKQIASTINRTPINISVDTTPTTKNFKTPFLENTPIKKNKKISEKDRLLNESIAAAMPIRNENNVEKSNLDFSQSGIDWDDNSHIEPNFEDTIYEAMKK